MLNHALRSSVTRITEVTELQLALLDGILHNENEIPSTEKCNYCVTLEQKSAKLELEEQREYQILLQEVQKALRLAATAYSVEEQRNKSQLHKIPVPEKANVVGSGNNCRDAQTKPSTSRIPAIRTSVQEKAASRIHKPLKASYIPAHHKAPYKTEPCRLSGIRRNQTRLPSRAATISHQSKCPKITGGRITKPTSTEAEDRVTLSNVVIDSSVTMEVSAFGTTKNQCNSSAKPSLSPADISISPDLPEAQNHEQFSSPNCVCKQKIRAELEQRFLHHMRCLQAKANEYRSVREIVNAESISRSFYLQCLRESARSTLDAYFHRTSEELVLLTTQFCQYLSHLDPKSTDSKQREWIYRIVTGVITAHRYMLSMYKNICRDDFHDRKPLPQMDVVSHRIITTKDRSSSRFNELSDNPLLWSYLTVGSTPSKYTRSRLVALTTTPDLCVFDGSRRDVARFLLLWSELESINLETKLFSVLRECLPRLKAVLTNQTKHRASTFREIYALVCGVSPIVLKDQFDS